MCSHCVFRAARAARSRPGIAFGCGVAFACIPDWQACGHRVKFVVLVADARGRKPRNFADAASYLNHVERADDHILAAESAVEAQDMLRMLQEAVTPKGLTVRDDKLKLSTTYAADPITCGWATVAPPATVEFSGSRSPLMRPASLGRPLERTSASTSTSTSMLPGLHTLQLPMLVAVEVPMPVRVLVG